MNNKISKILIILSLVFGLVCFLLYGYYTNYIGEPIGKETEVSVNNLDDIKETPEPEIVENIVKEEDKYTEATITAVGDVMLHLPTVGAYYDPVTGGYDFNPIFKYVGGINSDSDLTIANLETVTKNNIPFSGFPNFNSPKEIIGALKNSGFNLIGTANNHSCDQEIGGIVDTINNVRSYGLENVGTNLSPDVDRYRFIDVNGIKLGVIACTYGINGHVISEDYYINFIDKEKIGQDIQALREKGADKIILFIHWGVEYQTQVSDETRQLAYEFLDMGIDYILGSHPHVVNEIEKIAEEKVIVYSMGNFLSNQRKESLKNLNVEDGLIIKLKLRKNLTTNKTSLEDFDVIPTWVNKYYTDKLNYEIIPVNLALNNQLEGLVLDDRLVNELTNSKNRVENILGIRTGAEE